MDQRTFSRDAQALVDAWVARVAAELLELGRAKIMASSSGVGARKVAGDRSAGAGTGIPYEPAASRKVARRRAASPAPRAAVAPVSLKEADHGAAGNAPGRRSRQASAEARDTNRSPLRVGQNLEKPVSVTTSPRCGSCRACISRSGACQLGRGAVGVAKNPPAPEPVDDDEAQPSCPSDACRHVDPPRVEPVEPEVVSTWRLDIRQGGGLRSLHPVPPGGLDA